MKNRILIIEDEPSMRLGMSHFLSSSGYSVAACKDGPGGLAAIEKEAFDLVITDLKLPGCDGMTLLERIKSRCPDTGVIIITAYADVRTAVQAIKAGAFDYIAKPFSNEEMLITIERLLKFRNIETELNRLKETMGESGCFENIIGASPAMKDVFDRIASIADADVPVLIQGESGTGKELVANAIHNLSRRKFKSCIKINCAAIPENLFESELFGHEKGAFTGATETKKGKFETANKGCIFFDEIGDMPVGMQAKLLRVIEEQTITRVGGNEPVSVDVRAIYATSKNLREIIKKGGFREDLFYRINVVPIFIRPLRERREDIPQLTNYFLRYFSEKYRKPDLKISPFAYEAMMSYDYPGNVRELKHAVERAVLLSGDGVIDVNNLPEEMLSAGGWKVFPQPETRMQASVASLERQMIINALNETKGRKTAAARRLGISRKVLWKKIKDYSIEGFPLGNI